MNAQESTNEAFSESYLSIGLGLLVVLVVGILLYNFFSAKRSQTTSQNSEETTQEATTSAQLPETHTVEEGETLWGISEKYYQNGEKWTDIAAQNGIMDETKVEKGQVLTLPKVQQVLPETGISDQTATHNDSYTIQENDSLWNIACQQYNDCYAWVKIAQANNLNEPGIIHTGNVLTLP